MCAAKERPACNSPWLPVCVSLALLLGSELPVVQPLQWTPYAWVCSSGIQCMSVRRRPAMYGVDASGTLGEECQATAHLNN